MEVIATRYKKINYIFSIIFGALLIALYCLVFSGVETESKFITVLGLVLGSLLELLLIYFAISPKNAIIIQDDKLFIKYPFNTKKIDIKDIEYASTGGWKYKDFRTFFGILNAIKDVSSIWITYKENRHYKRMVILNIEGASGVETAINALLKTK